MSDGSRDLHQREVQQVDLETPGDRTTDRLRRCWSCRQGRLHGRRMVKRFGGCHEGRMFALHG